ncbi:hypothetical protein DH2020_008092 [Rehmannia glutinosa]|uniref:Uncharacterized protein n=1 Tax=Rehmannia glutinosa TaxID=99300 RepID=A0ABR0U003_REHGL
MEIRRCGDAHFIRAIRGGSVIKVLNTNSRGRKTLLFKTLNDVYEGKNTKTLRQPPIIESRNMHAGSVFDYKHVKREVPCLPMVDRTLREINPETDEFVPHSDGLDDDLDDDTTLKQLKERFLEKKRKFGHSDEHSNLANADEHPVEDESDVNLPVVDRTLREIKSEKDEIVPHSDDGLDNDLGDHTTLKQLNKRFQEKKRKFGHSQEHSKLGYTNENPVEDESDLNEPIINWKSKNSRRSKAKKKWMKGSIASSSTTAFCIKSELNLVSEDSQQVGGDLAPVVCAKVEDDAEELESQRKTSFADDSSFCNNEEPSPGGEVSNGIQKMTVQLELREPLFSAEECQNCVTNEISYDHLEHIEPVSVIVPSDGMSVKLETPELHCHEFLDLPPLTIQKGKEFGEAHCSGSSASDDVCMLSRSSSSMEEVSGEVVILVSKFLTWLLTVPLSALDFAMNLIWSSFRTILRQICHMSKIILRDEILNSEERQASASPIANAETQSSPKNHSFGSTDTISTTEPRQPPDRLLSTRKAISPSSQEQLCWAMNSVELLNDVDQCIGSERKGQSFDKETRKKASSAARSDIQHAKTAVNHGGHGHVSQRKVIISSRHLIKKSQNPKLNLEGPRFTRILPNLSTECTSIQGCSESAIAFSQRQMQDMESLAMKLMDELESMKGVVEQKLLFEAYRNVSLKSDADEKLTPNDGTASKDVVPREKKKIMFADEAGGKLCHVKFFEAGVSSPVSDGVKQ